MSTNKYENIQNVIQDLHGEELTPRISHLLRELRILKMNQSVKAFHLVVEHMGRRAGMERHNGDAYFTHLGTVAQSALDAGFNQATRDDNTIAACKH